MIALTKHLHRYLIYDLDNRGFGTWTIRNIEQWSFVHSCPMEGLKQPVAWHLFAEACRTCRASFDHLINKLGVQFQSWTGGETPAGQSLKTVKVRAERFKDMLNGFYFGFVPQSSWSIKISSTPPQRYTGSINRSLYWINIFPAIFPTLLPRLWKLAIPLEFHCEHHLPSGKLT